MAMAAEARQILDLKMGAAFTRYVTLSVRERVRTKGVLPIGPCQTPTCGFVYEREHAIRNFIHIRVNDCYTQHLMLIGDFPCFRACFHTIRVTMNLIRRKITCAIDRNQIAAVHKDHWFQNLPALEFAENIFE
jgi:hypothetical protein